MAGVHQQIPQLDPCDFPITDISSVVKIFKKELDKSNPDLALLSIIAGAIENSLTCSKGCSTFSDCELIIEEPKLPKLDFAIVNALYSKFHTIIKGSLDLSLYDTKFATRELIKRVSDVIWNSLTRSYYKDKAHLQSLYSYLTGNKLDCFGVAFAVVAGCQVLGFSDVHLALSEDHAWVVYGENSSNTAEVTWHGKGSEDKRGESVENGIRSRSWLYVNGCAVICTRHMEVAALTSSMNPSLTITSDSAELTRLQHSLLWFLYDMGHLARYPMAIGNLAELEDLRPTPGRVPCFTLFQEAITSARKYYKNMHVYPYTYQAGYFYRHALYKQAFKSWGNASDVIRQYNYSRDDEEIYKELMEIANELIPHAMKVEGSGHNAHSILKEPECFADLLRFYDGVCQWEEDSPTPVLHIGWAKPLVNTISKFDANVRSQVEIVEEEEENPSVSGENNNDVCLSAVTASAVGDAKIAALAAECGERLLSRDFLLGAVGGGPWAGEPEETTPGPSAPTTSHPPPRLPLRSAKMRGLRDLLLADKLNTHAISLQLTAQSQVISKKQSAAAHPDQRPKRHRRE